MLSWDILAAELLGIVPQVLLTAWIFCRLLPLRRPVQFTALFTLAATCVHLLFLQAAPAPLWVKPLVQLTLALALPCLFTGGSRLAAVFLTLIQCTVMVLVELLTVVLTRWGAAEPGLSFFYSVPAAKLLMLRTVYNVLYGVLLLPVYFLWRQKHNSGLDYAAPELMPFLLCQTAMTILACAVLLSGTVPSLPLHLMTAAAALLGLLAMGVVMTAHFEIQDCDRLERRRQLAAHQALLQRQRQAADPAEAAAEALRRELRGRVEEAMERLERREEAGAREQILGADRMLQTIRPTRYCAHPVADAVLWEQARRCEAGEIRLEARVDLPADAGLSGAAICSLFSNILDNAVHACLALPVPRRWIRCTAACRGAYLIVREENPWDPDAPAHDGPSSGSGFGLQILSELARRCDGSVEVQRDDGCFRITVCLRRDLPADRGEAAR